MDLKLHTQQDESWIYHVTKYCIVIFQHYYDIVNLIHRTFETNGTFHGTQQKVFFQNEIEIHVDSAFYLTRNGFIKYN